MHLIRKIKILVVFILLVRKDSETKATYKGKYSIEDLLTVSEG